jgi:polar amino acid transport system permease protein
MPLGQAAPAGPWFGKRVRVALVQSLLFPALMAGVAWVVWAGAASMGYNWQWNRVIRYVFRVRDNGIQWGLPARGFVQTLVIAAYAAVIAADIGTLIAVLRLSGTFAGRWLARI